MYLTMMKAKIHRAMVTQCDMHYQGSISVMKIGSTASAFANEQVDVLNINTGARFTTHAIPAERSKTIGINGAAARLAERDMVIIIAYAQMDEEAAKAHEPAIFLPEKEA